MNQTELRCIENLLNCFCREISFPRASASFLFLSKDRALLRISLRQARLEAWVSSPSLTGTFECLELPRLWQAGSTERRLNRRALALALIEEVEHLAGESAHPELLRLIDNSFTVTDRLTRGQPRRLSSYIESEQALTFGHPFHPSPKSREGFSEQELETFSPEFGAAFALHWFEMPAHLLQSDALDPSGTLQRIMHIAGASPERRDHVLLPLHPWQAGFVKALPVIAQTLASGLVRDRGALGPKWFATSSVRTLYCPEHSVFLKTSLNVRITNCIRRNATHELQSALYITKLLRERSLELQSLFPKFTPLDETGWLTLNAGALGLRGAEASTVEESFGLMVRDGRLLSACDSGLPVVAAALFGNRTEGRLAAQELIPASQREQWLGAYFERLIHPTLYLFCEKGLMFEPHLQNVLVGVRAHAPRVFLRDYDNAKLVEEWFHCASLEAQPKGVQKELRTRLMQAWPRFAYCLFVNNVAEAIGALAAGDRKQEHRYWMLLKSSLESYLGRWGSERSRPLVADLLQKHTLPAKTNLLTRAFKRRDRDAGFVGIRNPMAAVGLIA